MKKVIIVALLALGICLFAACNGGRTPKNIPDTGKDTYKVGKDTSKPDTGKVASTDHSSNGGSDLVKDTTKHK